MREGEASRTAAYMALFRALEFTLPAGQRLFEDRFASAFLPPRLRLVAHLSRIRLAGDHIRAYIDRQWPGARTSAVARTKFIDDAAEAALRSGVVQVVILGAGFDARAYRIPSMAHAVVFEVDHPSTSARKRRAVESVLGSLPRHVQFVPIDFTEELLSHAMSAAGYDPSSRTLFIWEGVTNYLTEDAVDGTLRWCASAAVGSTVLFTYVHRQVLDSPEAFEGTKKLFATLRAADERWTFGLDPSSLRTFLAERGLMLDEDVRASECRVRYFGPSAGDMRGYEFYRIAVARVPDIPPATGMPPDKPSNRGT
jgi:methyltransferase (TIGR00027 family)